MNIVEQRIPTGVVILIAVTIAIGALTAAINLGVLEGEAVHDNVACNDDVPAGWSCAPLVNKPQSGPGVTSPAIGELLYKFPDTNTLWVSVRALPGEGAIDLSGAQFCMDDDDEPYNAVGGTQGNQFHDCTGGGAAGQNLDDGTGNIPPADAGEEDEGADGRYEVRIIKINTDDTTDGLDYSEFSDVGGYLFFVYHVNIGESSTQAFFEQIQPPTPLTPTVTTEIHAGTDHATDIQNTTVDVGTVVHDQATVSGSGPTPTGSVDFMRFSTIDCTGSSVDENDVALSDGVAESSDFTTVAGSLSYKVHYDGDASYDAADSACEPLTVISPPVLGEVLGVEVVKTADGDDADTTFTDLELTSAGSTITYQVVIDNDSNVPVTIASLVDDVYGAITDCAGTNFNGDDFSDVIGQTLAADNGDGVGSQNGGPDEVICTFTETAPATDGTTVTDTVEVCVEGSSPVCANDDATIQTTAVLAFPPTGGRSPSESGGPAGLLLLALGGLFLLGGAGTLAAVTVRRRR